MTYEMIKKNYDQGLWNERMVRVAVDKGVLTAAQCEEILVARKEGEGDE